MNKKLLFVFSLLVSTVTHAIPSPLNKLPDKKLAFTENKGQITDQFGQSRKDIQFKVSSPELNVFVSHTGLHYQWNAMEQKGWNSSLSSIENLALNNLSVNSYRMDVTLLGANPNTAVITEKEQIGIERYYTPTVNPQNNTVHSYHKVTYKNVYPHIDWALYIEEGHTAKPSLKYDFVVHPGGKVSDIQLQFNGASQLGIKEDGSLNAFTPMGHIQEKAPYSYSIPIASNGATTTIASHFTLNNNILSFQTDPHDGTLVIDPELEWATYYGGTLWDMSVNTFADGQDNVYMTGVATSANNIATTGAYQTTFGGGFIQPDGFIAKFTPGGTRIWATYYGGSKGEIAYGAALDIAGNIYLSGYTTSTSAIATPGSFQPALGGYNDVFLVKFDSTGKRIWGTYYGGPEDETGGFVATDPQCNVYLAGYTKSTASIATPGSFKSIFTDKDEDAFLVKFDSAGQRKWGTYFGGTGKEYTNGVACDSSGNVYLSGYTQSTSDIATANSYQSTHAGGTNDYYLAKFNASGGREWATYYGGPGDDNSSTTATLNTDAAGNIYLGGQTNSTTGIASSGSHQDTLGGDIDAFLAKFNAAGQRQWGTYYGGSGQEWVGYMAIDDQGNIVWSGSTRSADNMATAGSLQPVFGGGISSDVFVVKLNKEGKRQWATYLGGAGNDEGNGVAIDNSGNIYLCGNTGGNGFPVTPGSHQDTISALISNGFLVKLCGATLSQKNIINGSDSVCPNSNAIYSLASIEGATSYIWTLPDGWTGSSDSSSISVQSNNTGGNLQVQIIKCNDTSTSISKDLFLFTPLPAIITIDGFTLKTLNTHKSYQWLLNNMEITGATSSTYAVKENGIYRVVTTDEHSCTDTSEIYDITNYTGIGNQHRLASQVNIYPNPAQDVVYINAPFKLNGSLSSIEGRVISEQESVAKIDLSQLPEGIYILRLTDDKGTLIKVQKLIKDRH